LVFVSGKENCPGEQFCLPCPAEKYCQGKKRIFKGGKKISLGKFFSTFLSLGKKSGKELSLGIFFSSLGQYFSAGLKSRQSLKGIEKSRG
jgi:hypothetical protein